jgi:hypothetical protein
MSIESRKRNEKRPTTSSKNTHAPQSPTQALLGKRKSPEKKPTNGAFGGCTVARRKQKLAVSKETA